MTVDESGRSHLSITASGPELARFHALLREEAAKLAALGDRSPLPQRMARALGVIAYRQAALTSPRPPSRAGGRSSRADPRALILEG